LTEIEAASAQRHTLITHLKTLKENIQNRNSKGIIGRNQVAQERRNTTILHIIKGKRTTEGIKTPDQEAALTPGVTDINLQLQILTISLIDNSNKVGKRKIPD